MRLVHFTLHVHCIFIILSCFTEPLNLPSSASLAFILYWLFCCCCCSYFIPGFAQGLLLVGSGNHIQGWGLNPGRLHARKMPYLLYFCSTPSFWLFFFVTFGNSLVTVLSAVIIAFLYFYLQIELLYILRMESHIN